MKKSLLDVRPNLKKYFHPQDNNNLEFHDISYGSKSKVFFRCDKCNKLQSEKEAKSVNSYTKLNRNKDAFYKNFECAYCNYLAVKRPEIASEWDCERNTGTPFDYKRGNRYKAYWKCEQGHEWQT
ncbi:MULTISPECIES: zinc-ribbon domain-containing protein [Bacillus]|uniref:zinc-ribbon domain-containing protein n=1 Tax=Bacillus TaxID=1386 RepID=UPI00128ECBAD|nr:zinc-ribbon domain-containing protein [Bacillus pumilus]MCY7677862.1 zinc-ribbon domain-containing protein [Bacillus pumilus]